MDKYVGKDGVLGMYFMPRHVADWQKKELARALRFTGKTAALVSFKLPRKGTEFPADLYPPHRSQRPALSFQ